MVDLSLPAVRAKYANVHIGANGPLLYELASPLGMSCAESGTMPWTSRTRL